MVAHPGAKLGRYKTHPYIQVLLASGMIYRGDPLWSPNGSGDIGVIILIDLFFSPIKQLQNP